jgi:hypothetical protein
MITIDDKTYNSDELSPAQQASVQRVLNLQSQVSDLTVQINELNLLVSAYYSALKGSLNEEK